MAEFIVERSAIMEFDGGLERVDARKAADQPAAVKYPLRNLYGDPPALGGGNVGGQSDSADDVLRAICGAATAIG